VSVTHITTILLAYMGGGTVEIMCSTQILKRHTNVCTAIMQNFTPVGCSAGEKPLTGKIKKRIKVTANYTPTPYHRTSGNKNSYCR